MTSANIFPTASDSSILSVILPGWKALKDMDKLCSKLLLLNRLTPVAKSRESAARQWEQLLIRLSHIDDADQILVNVVRAIPTIVAKMNAEHIYSI